MKQKAPVTMRSVIARINRRLKSDLEMLKTSRGERMQQAVGDHYVIDYRINAITHKDVDPEQMARELGVLREYEKVVA